MFPRTLYLRKRLAYQFRNVAIGESWQMADLARVVILARLTIHELHEAEEEIRSKHELIAGIEALTRLTRGRVNRSYRRNGMNRRGRADHSLPSCGLPQACSYIR